MTKSQCKGKRPSEISAEIKEAFVTHCEIVGDASLKWDRLFRFLVIDNNLFPADEPVAPICADFFAALHRNDIERFGTTIEAHTRAFGQWFPRYWKNITLRRAGEALYGPERQEPIHDTPKPSEAVTRQNWNLMRGDFPIGRIRSLLATYDELMSARNDRRPLAQLSGIDNFTARLRASLERYNVAFANKGEV